MWFYLFHTDARTTFDPSYIFVLVFIEKKLKGLKLLHAYK